MDIVIANLIHPNMVQCGLSTITHAMTTVTQEKTQSYEEHTS
jgi:hypothetical protein